MIDELIIQLISFGVSMGIVATLIFGLSGIAIGQVLHLLEKIT